MIEGSADQRMLIRCLSFSLEVTNLNTRAILNSLSIRSESVVDRGIKDMLTTKKSKTFQGFLKKSVHFFSVYIFIIISVQNTIVIK